MKNNRLLIALVVLIGVGALAVTMSRSHQAETTLEAPDFELPKIKKEELTQIDIVKPKGETISLSKKDGAWQLASPAGAKADMTAVDALLDQLSSLELVGVAATRKENHAKLQVDEASALHVKAKAGDKLLLDILVGVSKSGNTMVRLNGKETTLVARGGVRLPFDKEAKMFRDRVITDLDSTELTGLVLASKKGTFKFDKPDKTWAQAAEQAPIKDFSDAKVQSLASSLARLRAADFAEPSVTPEAAGFSAPEATVSLIGKADARTVLELGNLHPDGNEYFVRVSGKDTIFRISKALGERMLPDASAFVADKNVPSPEDEADGMPPGMMPPGNPHGQLPPELMEQLRRQLATQGAQP